MFACMHAAIERLQVTSQYYVIHFRVAKPLMSLESYKSIWFVFVVRTIVLREIIKQREKWEFIFTEFRKIRLNERFGSMQLIGRVNPSSSTVICSQHFVGGKYVFLL